MPTSSQSPPWQMRELMALERREKGAEDFRKLTEFPPAAKGAIFGE